MAREIAEDPLQALDRRQRTVRGAPRVHATEDVQIAVRQDDRDGVRWNPERQAVVVPNGVQRPAMLARLTGRRRDYREHQHSL
jgi:hypothetical protein